MSILLKKIVETKKEAVVCQVTKDNLSVQFSNMNTELIFYVNTSQYSSMFGRDQIKLFSFPYKELPNGFWNHQSKRITLTHVII